MNRLINILSRNRTTGLFLIFALVLAARGNIFQNQFVMDDFDFIVDWPLIQDWKNLPHFFVGYTPPPGQEGIYSPLKTLFHAVLYHLYGLNPLGYHITSILIHFSGIYLIYKISYRLTSDAAATFICSLLFALHPVQVEATTYMTASIDMIGIVFLFAAFLNYCQARERQDHFGLLTNMYAFTFAILAVFTHELAISIPFLLLWYEVCFASRPINWRGLIWRILPFFVLVGIYAALKGLVLNTITRGNYLYDNFYLTMLVTLQAWAKYVYICLFPVTLTHNHIIAKGISSFAPDDFDKIAVLTQSLFDIHTLLAVVVLGGLATIAAMKLKTRPIIAFCIGWFFIALWPVSNFIPSGVFFGERYLYPGMLGFTLLLGLYFSDLAKRNGSLFGVRYVLIITFLAGGIACAYALRSWIRNKDWRNEVIFYEAAVRANPQSALMRTDLGVVYLRNKNPDKALASLQGALAIRSDDSVIYFVMSEAYLQKGQRTEAKEALKQAIGINPESAQAHYNLAGLYALEGRTDKAREHFDLSIYYLRQRGEYREAQELEKAFRNYFGSK